jgi:hypothetical protein
MPSTRVDSGHARVVGIERLVELADARHLARCPRRASGRTARRPRPRARARARPGGPSGVPSSARRPARSSSTISSLVTPLSLSITRSPCVTLNVAGRCRASLWQTAPCPRPSSSSAYGRVSHSSRVPPACAWPARAPRSAPACPCAGPGTRDGGSNSVAVHSEKLTSATRSGFTQWFVRPGTARGGNGFLSSRWPRAPRACGAATRH